MNPKFTVIVPTFNHEDTLNYSLESLRLQSYKNFKAYVIGDGSTKRTEEIVKKFTEKDHRFVFVSKPKGPRNGEIYRHEILRSIKTGFVAYLSDDDLWLPNHLSEISKLLKKSDFCYTFPVDILPNGKVETWFGELDSDYYQHLLLSKTNQKYNFIPLSCTAHTIKAYHKLPYGWRTTPDGIHTDLYMWKQFLDQKWIRVARNNIPTVYHFASVHRKSWSSAKRIAELQKWFAMQNSPETLLQVMGKLNEFTYSNLLYFLQAKNMIEQTRTWKIRTALLKRLGVEKIRNYLKR